MTEMGRYCKAYLVKDLRGYEGWRESLSALRQETDGDAPTDGAPPRQTLNDDDVLYLQENFVVTDGVFKDEHVVFSDASEEWKAFCRDTLEFHVAEGDDDRAADEQRPA